MSTSKSFTLILLYDKMSASLPVAQALKEKNIDVHVAQNAGELIQLVANKNVDLVGLSANHASSRSLIQVLREKTVVKILIFGEDKSQGTADRVDKLDGDFRVLGVATAYNIWMKIANMVKNKQKESETNGNVLYSGGKKSTEKKDSAIIVKSNKEKGAKVEGGAFSSKKKKEKFKKSENSEQQSDMINFQDQSGEPAQEKESSVMFFKKDASEGKKSKKKKGFLKEVAAETDTDTKDEQPIDPLRNRKTAKQGGDAVIDDLTLDVELGNVQDQREKSDDSIGDVLEVGMQSEDKGIGSVSSSGFGKNKNKKSAKQAVAKAAPEVPLKDQVLEAVTANFTSNEESPEEFGSVNRMTVVPVDKENGRGFLIFCTKDNQFMGSSGPAFEAFKASLLEKMAEHEAISIGEVYNIETEEIDLNSMVQNNSDFHVMVQDPKSQKQICICFVATENIYPDTNKSSETNMLQIELNVIPAQTPISFNLFLHFGKNNRMIPYIRRGGELSQEQVSRLTERGVQSAFIPEEERKALYSFFISQTIHQDIRPNKKAA